jgi:predicted acyl esterase
MQVPFHAYFGPVSGHGSDTTYSETIFHSKFIDNWLNLWVFGTNDPEFIQSQFVYASSTNPVSFHHWDYVHFVSNDWPPQGTAARRFYFNPGMKLTNDYETYKQDTVSILNDVRDKKIRMEDASRSGFTGNDFNNKFIKTYIYFETEPLQNDMKVVGSPQITLFYTSSADICQFNFQIWEVDENGQMNFVSRANLTDRHLYTKSVKENHINGLAFSHIFKKGNRVRIYVTNIDNGPYDEFLRTNPFVLPVLKRAKNIIYMNGEKASYIEFPVTE